MFLKRLDVVGFKSFADRIGVEFVPGVTAVVGPNGSGKSNITDAIRWVLGEQSAKSLRGSKMQDIIFSGSDSRKSLNYAEVTLTLDNQSNYLPLDYNEISVTRKVYRSGDSEYFINKQSCRLKDIVDLFMDTGLGRESFSIIGQGKIEEILNSKAEEKRKIFEEAAGVLKYKQRKVKAELKLSETEDNLLRVEDILYELEDQIEPLKIQASIAKDYLEKREELEKIEVSLLAYEIEDFHEKWQKQSRVLEELKEQELDLSTSIKKGEAKLENNRHELHVLDESINDLQNVLLLTSEELEKLEGKKEVLKERQKNAGKNREELSERLLHFQAKKDYYETTLEEEQQCLVSQKDKLEQLHAQLDQETEVLTSLEEDVEAVIDSLKSDYIELLNKQAALKNEIRYLNEQIGQQERKSAQLDQEYKNLLQQRSELQSKKQKAEQKLAEVKVKLEDHLNRYYDLQRQLEKTEETYRRKESQLYQAFQYLQQARSRKEVLEEMQEDYAGFYQGVKEVLKERDTLKGIEGAVAELISVDKQYEVAVETALGAAMQHIVVDDEENARQAIRYLKSQRFGRATFLPLSVIKPRKLSEFEFNQLQNHASFIGAAANLITTNERYKPIISNLLGHVIVTKDLKSANELAKLLKYRYRIVTLEGDVVNPGGSMTGGSVKQSKNSLLSRQRELETVQHKLVEMEEQTRQLEEVVKKLKSELEEGRSQLEVMREHGETIRLDEQDFLNAAKEAALEEKSMNERLMLYDREKTAFQSEKGSIHKRLSELEETLSCVTRQAEEMEAEIESLTARKKSQQTNKEEVQEKITFLKIQTAEQQQSFKNQQEKVSRLKTEQKEILQELSYTEDSLRYLSEEINSETSSEGELEEMLSIKRAEKNETAKLIAERRENRLTNQQKIEDQEQELKQVKRQQKQVLEIVRHEEIKCNRLDMDLENRLNKLSEEYELTFERAKEKYPLMFSAEESRKQVKLLKMAIDELGTVNLGAIDEYERVQERYNFLVDQRDDLQHAKGTLHQVIGEMDEEMKKRFEQTFFEIREHFQIVFQELFGGGQADLALTVPEDLLNTGVDILAQPPGKKLQHLNLLSGGERALTAIALLFAILKVRPVPFCVLDEVEAALDEANVARFAGYLKRFSKETQFIVVTHRKGTMEEADVLYGVTMQESGVSKLVSVRLEESKQLVK
ncbi:chromosome segregation protein SMC [Bacillus taeanensis]|uniref:Chromosome partition protein Smc n=1 Tax=Bacillus taeanensis TaxID=273032 RepID=A0A366XTP2_9BACI|nr:chromosome segregation protein SMC [Bacillus taeanensis]RBW67523.1 chromosome segregation protein SMC [Bacillus taeanensis]